MRSKKSFETVTIVHQFRTDLNGRPLVKKVRKDVFDKFLSVIHENNIYKNAGWVIGKYVSNVKVPKEATLPVSTSNAKKSEGEVKEEEKEAVVKTAKKKPSFSLPKN